MALNTFKCNYLTPLHFKGLIQNYNVSFSFSLGTDDNVLLIHTSNIQ